MSERIEEAIKELNAKKEAEDQKKRAALLMRLDICDREYNPDARGYTRAYPNWENGKYFKKIPLEVTDEEYAQICELVEEEVPTVKSPNIVAVLKVFAYIVFFVGFIMGIILGFALDNIIVLFSYLIIAGILGTVLFALAEIVSLLSEINSKTKL